MNLTDIRTIKDIMTIHNIHFRKEFGQNFLTNISVVEDIADSCSDTPDATVLEIGPGIGVLTQELAFRYRKVIAVEIDLTGVDYSGALFLTFDFTEGVNLYHAVTGVVFEG